MPDQKGRSLVLDAITPVFEIEIDRQTFRLLYDVTAVSTYYAATEINPLLEGISKNPLHLVMLAWAGTRTHHPDLAIEEVTKWFTPKNTFRLCEFMYRALHEHSDDPNAEENAQPANPPNA